VLGRSFETLFTSTDVKLKLVQAPGRVDFEWTSRNEARLHEALILGQRMYDAKRLLEVTGPDVTGPAKEETAMQ
jgi:hypothetical protein